MIAPWIGILLGLVCCGLCLVIGNRLAKSPGISEELARKFVHVAMGITCLSFPWVFASVWPVFVLCGLSLIGLIVVKLHPKLRGRAGGCLYGVERQSLGELYFAVGIAVLFWWSDGDPLMFCVPTLVLTVADAAGALIGLRYGKTSYATLTGHKSAEGSAMFFLAAFMSAHVPLLLFSEIGRAEVLLVSLTLALLVMLVEAISTGGLDNLLIPLGGHFLLSEYMTMPIATLGGRFILVVLLVTVVLTLRKRSSLNGGALLGAALFGYGSFALGGWSCFIIPLIIFLSHLHATRRVATKVDETHTLSAVLSLSATGLVWLVFGEPPIKAFALGLVVHFAILSYNTIAFLDLSTSTISNLWRSTAKAVLFCYLPLVLLMPEMWVLALCAIPITLVGTACFSYFYPARPKVSDSAGRWVTQFIIATTASCFALLIP